MGMTIEDMYDWLYRLKSELVVYMPKEWHEPMKDSIQSAIVFSRKYQMLQADYENRLKTDLEAILVDLQLDVEGQKFDVHMDKVVWNDAIRVCSELIQQRINELKAEVEPQESENT